MHEFIDWSLETRIQGKEQEIQVKQTQITTYNPWVARNPKTKRELLTHDNGFHDSSKGMGKNMEEKPLGSSNFLPKSPPKLLLKLPSRMNEKDPKNGVKNVFLCCRSRTHAAAWVMAAAAWTHCPFTAETAFGRDCTDPFWKNGHRDFVHRWIELNFGYVVLNP